MNYLEDNKISIFLDAFTKVKVNFQIIMRVGDQMTDFNSNFFVDQKHNSKSYVEDKDIDVL
jgi:predicted secreted acid phosphatase